VRVAEAVAPETFKAAVPRVILPFRKVTLPLGATVPLAGFTVAVNMVEPDAAMLLGAAVAKVAVAGRAAVTVMVAAGEFELRKLPVAV
jgi:hypothetical protein